MTIALRLSPRFAPVFSPCSHVKSTWQADAHDIIWTERDFIDCKVLHSCQHMRRCLGFYNNFTLPYLFHAGCIHRPGCCFFIMKQPKMLLSRLCLFAIPCAWLKDICMPPIAAPADTSEPTNHHGTYSTGASVPVHFACVNHLC